MEATQQQLQFTKLKSIKVQHDSIVHFALKTYGNDAIITYPHKESIVLRIINEPDITGQVPYSIQSIEAPQERKLSNLIRNVDLRKIYGQLSVLERQEMGLDAIIVADASLEPSKPNILQAHLAPPATSAAAKTNKLMAITTYGECLIFYKNDETTKRWDNVACNVTQFLINVNPPRKTHITQYADLRALLDAYTCTACAWHDNGHIIYVATAAGSLLVFRMDEETYALELCFQLLTNIGRVTNLQAFDNHVIACSSNGLISLYQLLPQNGCMLVEYGLLWTDADDLSCKQIIVQQNQTPSGGYAIVCAKAAFVIVFLLSREGSLLGSAHTRIADIKVTGLAMFAENDFIVTTIRGKVFRVRFNYAIKGVVALELGLKTEELKAPITGDKQLSSMYGVGTTANKAIWFFLMNDVRNHCSRETARYSILLICKPNTSNQLEMIENLNYDTIDPYLDIMWAFRMDAWLTEAGGAYATFLPLTDDFELPRNLDNDFFRKLQIRLEIANVKLRHSSYELKCLNEGVMEEVEFLQTAIQIFHILFRLNYLRQLVAAPSNAMLSVFQQRAAFFMHKAFNFLLVKLTTCPSSGDVEKNETKNVSNDLRMQIAEFACMQLTENCLPAPKCIFEDVCLGCNSKLDDQTFTCRNCENSYRCSVSYMPLSIYCRLKCTQCSVLAYNDEDNSNFLSELFSPYEAVKCTFCSASFMD